MVDLRVDIGLVDLPDEDDENLIDELRHVLEKYIKERKDWYLNWKPL